MTERLTERSDGGFYILDKHKAAIFMYNKYYAGKAIDKLAQYETVEEEGRLVVLPCKVGDAVYLLFVTDVIEKKIIYEILKAKVTKITIDRFRAIFSFETLDKYKYKAEQTQEAFGETVFLTREEAEKALKEMEG